MIEIVKDGQVVSKSKNLRGIKTYARKHGMLHAVVNFYYTDENDRYSVTFLFKDGAICNTAFYNSQLAINFIQNAWSWGTYKLTHDNIAISYDYR